MQYITPPPPHDEDRKNEDRIAQDCEDEYEKVFYKETNNLKKLQEFEKDRIVADPPSWPYQPELAVFPDPTEIIRPEDLIVGSSMDLNHELAKFYYTHWKKIMLGHLGSLPWNKRSSVAKELYTTMCQSNCAFTVIVSCHVY